MKKINLSTNNKLALIALILGFIAVFFGTPYESNKAMVNTEELALNIIDTNNIISPLQLAEWIIQGKVDYRLIDLRDENQYEDYFIPGAENIPPTKIKSSELLRNEKILIYSDDELKTAQSWLLLKTLGYKNVYMLKGGIENWKKSIIFAIVTDETKEAKLIEISKYFGGNPKIGTGSEMNVAQELPKAALPKVQSPPSTGGTKKGKPKREGC